VKRLNVNTDSPGSSNKIFYEAACWAFGFMGVRDNAHLLSIGSTFQEFGTDAADGKVPLATNLESSAASQRMAQLRQKLLANAGSPNATINGATVPITIYGKFKKGAAPITPDHVWIECADMIWETFPGKGMTLCDATLKSRGHPPLLEAEKPNSFDTGCVASLLTQAQLDNINLFKRSLKAEERLEARVGKMQAVAAANSSSSSSSAEPAAAAALASSSDAVMDQ
jgi:hypothetical protein